MPQQKASSFAEDLAALEQPSSFAADLAELEATAQPPAEPSKWDRLTADNEALPKPARVGLAMIRAITNNPATAGAMAGGAIAAPFTGGLSLLPAAAAVGGASALGAGAGQLAAGQQPDLGTMATEGAMAATGQGVGRGLATIAGKLAPVLSRAILKPSKALQQEYGTDNIVNTFLKERVPVGKSAKVGAQAKASAATADSMIADAQASGAAPVSVREVATAARPVRDTAKLRVKLGKPDETPAVAARIKAIRSANPKGIPLTEAQTLKREAQDLARRTFRAIDRGNPVNDIDALTDKAVAQGLRAGIEARVPGVADVNARTQSLMGLEEALADAEMRSPGFMGTNPATWLGAVAPGFGSKVAFGVDSMSTAPLPGAFRNALLAALGVLEQEPNGP